MGELIFGRAYRQNEKKHFKTSYIAVLSKITPDYLNLLAFVSFKNVVKKFISIQAREGLISWGLIT